MNFGNVDRVAAMLIVGELGQALTDIFQTLRRAGVIIVGTDDENRVSGDMGDLMDEFAAFYYWLCGYDNREEYVQDAMALGMYAVLEEAAKNGGDA